MAENKTLDRLISLLSLEERQELLERLNDLSVLPADPLYESKPEDLAVDVAGNFNLSSWPVRCWFFVLSKLIRRSPQQVFEGHRIARIGRKISRQYPGLYNYRGGRLLPGFYTGMEKLKGAALFFFNALNAGFNRDRGAFYDFLGSLEMPAVYERLQETLDIHSIVKTYPRAEKTELRRIAGDSLEEAFDSLPGEFKEAMYAKIRYLFCLMRLASFPFDKVLRSFVETPESNIRTCPCQAVSGQLAFLNNILFSLHTASPPGILHPLFVFVLQEKVREPGFNLDKEISALLEKTEEAIIAIRDFSRRTPLTLILRCATVNFSLVPREIPGGEDWVVVYRDYRKSLIDEAFVKYEEGCHRQELLTALSRLLDGAPLKPLENIRSEVNPKGLPVKGGFALSILKTFYLNVFHTGIMRVIEPIFLDGIFARKDYRIEFAETYNELLDFEKTLTAFDEALSPVGNYGSRYYHAVQSKSKSPLLKELLKDVSGEAENMLESVRLSLFTMINNLDRILYHRALANIPKLSGTADQRNQDLTKSAIDKLSELYSLLGEADKIEGGE